MPLDNPISSPVATGLYTGDSTAQRAIAHTLGRLPKAVLIYQVVNGTIGYHFHQFISSQWDSGGGTWWVAMVCAGASGATGIAGAFNQTLFTTSYFYVGDASDYVRSANENTKTYYFIVLG